MLQFVSGHTLRGMVVGMVVQVGELREQQCQSKEHTHDLQHGVHNTWTRI